MRKVAKRLGAVCLVITMLLTVLVVVKPTEVKAADPQTYVVETLTTGTLVQPGDTLTITSPVGLMFQLLDYTDDTKTKLKYTVGSFVAYTDSSFTMPEYSAPSSSAEFRGYRVTYTPHDTSGLVSIVAEYNVFDGTSHLTSETDYFNPDTNTVTLANRTLTKPIYNYGSSTFNVVLEGTNNIAYTDFQPDANYGIYGKGNVVVSGSGTLNINIPQSDASYGVYSSTGSVTIQGANVNVSTNDNSVGANHGCGITANTGINITGATIDVEGFGFPISGICPINITNSTVVAESVGYDAIYAYEADITISGSDVTASGVFAIHGTKKLTIDDSTIETGGAILAAEIILADSLKVKIPENGKVLGGTNPMDDRYVEYIVASDVAAINFMPIRLGADNVATDILIAPGTSTPPASNPPAAGGTTTPTIPTSPKTADTNMPILWISMILLGLVGIVVAGKKLVKSE